MQIESLLKIRKAKVRDANAKVTPRGFFESIQRAILTMNNSQVLSNEYAHAVDSLWLTLRQCVNYQETFIFGINKLSEEYRSNSSCTALLSELSENCKVYLNKIKGMMEGAKSIRKFYYMFKEREISLEEYGSLITKLREEIHQNAD